jgi:hypothetical protein
MTKYFINSGGISHTPDKGKKFLNELVKDLGKNPKILYCLFARPREDWEKKFQEDLESNKSLLKGIEPEYKMAMPDEFTEQIKWCDILYIHGGDDTLLQYYLQPFLLHQPWKGKIVATSSASSNAFSRHFWTPDWRKCMNGLGFLPIKVIPHYNSNYADGDPRGPIDWNKALEELKKFGDQTLPIYALEEGEYEVFEL